MIVVVIDESTFLVTPREQGLHLLLTNSSQLLPFHSLLFCVHLSSVYVNFNCFGLDLSQQSACVLLLKVGKSTTAESKVSPWQQ